MLGAVEEFVDFVPACFEAVRASRSDSKRLIARRDALVESGRDHPTERLASLLVFLSSDNAHNGRDASVIADDFRCGVVADLLHMSIDELAGCLLELQAAGLVQATDAGDLKLTDLSGLERVAAGAPAA